MKLRNCKSNYHLMMMYSILISVIVSGCTHNDAPVDQVASGEAKRFSSPEKALENLIDAVTTKDREELLRIFGVEGAELVSSGDEVADEAALERFSTELLYKHSLESQSDRSIVIAGKDNWPFPVPIMQDGAQWYFNSSSGREEILNRRIGENELKTIRFVRSYVEAQKNYFASDRDGDGVREYAQKAFSTPGEKDGLYWKAEQNEEQSPFGPLAAQAAQEGYRRKGEASIPFHGYFFTILTAQGQAATEGAMSYLDQHKNMTRGFALVAYPARWGTSGLMTFIVNHEGILYERDLGVQTLAAVGEMKEFNPDDGWEPVLDFHEDKVEE